MSRRKRKKSSPIPKLIIALLLAAIVFSTVMLSGCLESTMDKIYRNIYPLSYEDEITAAAETYGLEPELIAAVIYAESGFDVDAHSHADAKGLMQILPDTFLWLVDYRGEDYTEEDLLTPEVNIDYGCYYLNWLDEKVPGDIYNAAAAYNAGFVHVEEWLENPDYSPDGVTLTTIPYKETESYVNKIKHAEEMYAKLYFDNEEYQSSIQ